MDVFDISKLRSCLRGTNTGLWQLRYNGEARQLFVDPVMEQLIGAPSDISPEDRFVFHLQHVHADDAEIFQDYSKRLAQGDTTEVNYRYMHPTLGLRYVRCNGSPGIDDDGSRFVSGFHRDITEMVRLEKEREDEERRAHEQALSKALEEAQQANAYLLEQYEISQAVTHDVEDIFLLNVTERTSSPIKVGGKVVPHELRSPRPYDETWDYYLNKYVHPDNQEALRSRVHLDNVKSELDEKGPFAIRYRIVTDTDEAYCQASFVYVGGQGPRNIVFGLRQIDELVKEERLRAQELEEARNAAQAANEAKTNFLFSMSHDIRTPMNAIMGYNYLLKKGLTDPQLLQYQQKMEQAGGVLLSLINNVLNMARIDSGQVEFEPAYLHAGNVTKNVMDIFSQAAAEKNITFVHTVDVQHRHIACDLVKTHEVFTNLISNAVKYTEPGGTITIATVELPSDDPEVAVMRTTISDTGVGMSPDFLPHLFEEFSRERTATESRIEGTGLGMPIVKKLVEVMGGTITVESELGVGTTFTMVFPHRLLDEDDNPNKEQPDQSTKHCLGKNALLVEDNDLNAEIAEVILTDLGFICQRAVDGLDCLEILEGSDASHFDLIFMDVQMPRMNGYDTTRSIRSMEDKKKANIPIIAMTANAFDEDKRIAFSAGMNDHVSKPINIAELTKAINRVLR